MLSRFSLPPDGARLAVSLGAGLAMNRPSLWFSGVARKRPSIITAFSLLQNTRKADSLGLTTPKAASAPVGGRNATAINASLKNRLWRTAVKKVAQGDRRRRQGGAGDAQLQGIAGRESTVSPTKKIVHKKSPASRTKSRLVAGDPRLRLQAPKRPRSRRPRSGRSKRAPEAPFLFAPNGLRVISKLARAVEKLPKIGWVCGPGGARGRRRGKMAESGSSRRHFVRRALRSGSPERGVAANSLWQGQSPTNGRSPSPPHGVPWASRRPGHANATRYACYDRAALSKPMPPHQSGTRCSRPSGTAPPPTFSPPGPSANPARPTRAPATLLAGDPLADPEATGVGQAHRSPSIICISRPGRPTE